MYQGADNVETLEPLPSCLIAQYHSLRRFHHEYSNLKYLIRLPTVPKLGQKQPELRNNVTALDLPVHLSTSNAARAAATPAPAALSPDAAMVEQERMIKEYGGAADEAHRARLEQ